MSGMLMFVTAQAQPKLERVEYYIDNDPGYGNAIPVSGIKGNNISDRTLDIKIDTLSPGIHLLGIRAKDAKGAWSLDNSWLFLKPDTSFLNVPNIVRSEYYIDKDPGYGKGIEIAISNAKNYPGASLFVNVSGLTAGKHKIAIRSRDSRGNWSLDNVDSFMVSVVVNGNSITAASIAAKSICQGGQVKVGYQKSGAFNKNNIFKVQLSDSLGKFGSNPLEIGSIKDTGNNIITCSVPAGLHGSGFKVRVVSTNPAITSANAIDSIKINSQPPPPVITPPGPLQFCRDTTVTLTASVGYTSYLWNTNATTRSINVSVAGSYVVTGIDASGCQNTSDSVKISYQTCAKPGAAKTKNITTKNATLTWKANPCALKYRIQYRQLPGTFTTITTGKADTAYKLTGLLPGTAYEWKVTSVCDTNPDITSAYSKPVSFTTKSAGFTANVSEAIKNNGSLKAVLYPNPAKDIAYVSITNAKGNIAIFVTDINGRQIWKTGKIISGEVSIPVKNLSQGNYIVQVKDNTKTVILRLIKE